VTPSGSPKSSPLSRATDFSRLLAAAAVYQALTEPRPRAGATLFAIEHDLL
jgi:hypothetical protein